MHIFFTVIQMLITTNIGLRDYLRTGTIWHGDFDSQFGKGATLLIGHGIWWDKIGHFIPPGAAAGVAQLDVNGDFVEELSGIVLLLS